MAVSSAHSRPAGSLPAVFSVVPRLLLCLQRVTISWGTLNALLSSRKAYSSSPLPPRWLRVC